MNWMVDSLPRWFVDWCRGPYLMPTLWTTWAITVSVGLYLKRKK